MAHPGFFQRQASARRNTGLLVALFLAAVVIITLLVSVPIGLVLAVPAAVLLALVALVLPKETPTTDSPIALALFRRMQQQQQQ